MKHDRLLQRFATATLLFASILPGVTSRAESIGGSFGGGNGGNAALAPTDVAGYGPFAQANFNLIKARATNLALNNQSGLATAVTLTTSGFNDFSAIVPAAASPDEVFNNDRAKAAGTTASFTLSNIPYANYSILVYDIQVNASAKLSINVGTQTYYTSSPQYNAVGYLDNNAATPYTYTQSTSTDLNAPTAESNFVMFTNLTGSSATINLSDLGGGLRVSGFQLVEAAVPEPSTWAMLGLGAGALGLVLRGRRRIRIA